MRRPLPPLTTNPLCAERRTCSARRLDICSESPLPQHELSSPDQCCLCIRLEHLQVCCPTLCTLRPHRPPAPYVHPRYCVRSLTRSPPALQLKRYNKSRLDHDAHAVAAESLLLLKSSPPHNAAAMGAAVDPVHPKPSALSQVRATRHLSVLPCSAPARPHTAAPVVHPWWQLASAPDLHRNVQLALERWPNRPVAPEPSRQVDAVRRVKAQLLTSGSLPRGEVVCLGTAAPPGETAVLTPCYLSYISRY